MPRYLQGAWMTIVVSLLASVLAITIGLAVALSRMSRSRILRIIARVYVDLIRGTPALLQILFVFFGLPQLGFRIDPIPAGVVALGINSGAYLGEIFRSGIQSVDTGQSEAGRSLGMSHITMMRRIVLPQAFRRVIPPATGEMTNLVKGTSLLSVIAITELTRVAQQVVGLTFRPIEAYLAIGAMYLIINTVVSLLSSTVERRLEIPT
jgi:His/Glu/Gln/Arg/opine family amino acid ABC transporter permease subunit